MQGARVSRVGETGIAREPPLTENSSSGFDMTTFRRSGSFSFSLPFLATPAAPSRDGGFRSSSVIGR